MPARGALVPGVDSAAGKTGGVGALRTRVAAAEDAIVALQAADTALGTWAAFTPALTASVTDPTLGTGPTQAGRYVQVGKLVVGYGLIQFGTGSTKGSGEYLVSLPVLGSFAHDFTIGSGRVHDWSGASTYVCELDVDETNDQRCRLRYASGAAMAAVGDTTPFTFADSDRLLYSFSYEAA